MKAEETGGGLLEKERQTLAGVSPLPQEEVPTPVPRQGTKDVNSSTEKLMRTMREMMKKEEEKNESSRMRKKAAMMRKEEARKEEDSKQREANKNVKEMMRMWGGDGGAAKHHLRTGNPPKITNHVRKRGEMEKELARLEGRSGESQAEDPGHQISSGWNRNKVEHQEHSGDREHKVKGRVDKNLQLQRAKAASAAGMHGDWGERQSYEMCARTASGG